MPTRETSRGAPQAARLTPGQLRELQDTFQMRGLMPVEQARLLAHVEATERELEEQRSRPAQKPA